MRVSSKPFLSRTDSLRVLAELKESGEGSTVLGSIQLPSSLFETLADKEASELGLWFSLHKSAIFFPHPDTAAENGSVSTPVVSATLGGHHVEDLEEPVVITLRLLNQVCMPCVCVCVQYV